MPGARLRLPKGFCTFHNSTEALEQENFLFKNPKKMNIIRDGTGKSKNLKNQKNEHYDLKNEERDESLVLFLLVERNLIL